MKFLWLLWAGLWRKPARSVLTAICIVIGFLLLGLLEGVNAGFAKSIAQAGREYLVTTTRVRGGAPMPRAALDKIRHLPGVKEATLRSYFMGNYRERSAENTVSAIATDPEVFFRLRPGLAVTRENLDALLKDRMGMIVTPAMLDWFKWKVGDTVTLESQTLKTDGSPYWTFRIVGTLDTPRATQPAYFGVIHYAYLDESRVIDRGTAESFYVQIDDPTKAVAMAASIDSIFANSSHETRTRSDQQRAESRARQMGDVKFFTNAIMAAVLFTLAFLTGNTLRQALQERTAELGVLKALGYSNPRLLGLAYVEALLLYLPPAVVGLWMTRWIAPLMQEDIGTIGTIFVSPKVVLTGLACAALLAFIGVALPAWRLTRMSIVDALGRR